MADESVFKDFDQGRAEVEDRWVDVRFGGEDFKVNLNVDGGSILRWMRFGSKVEGVPKLLEIFFPDKADFERLLDVSAPWEMYEKLGLWLTEELSGTGTSGKGDPSSQTG